MNTYLTDSNFAVSAEQLDTKRLNRQRADVVTILKACVEPEPSDGKEHSAIKMWRGSEQVLIKYGAAICLEWIARGNTDTLLPKILSFSKKFEPVQEPPEWLGDPTFHASHRSYLLRLLPSWYSELFPGQRDDLPVVWPRTDKSSAARDERDRQKAIKRAHKARDRAKKALQDAYNAALEAGLNPENLEPLTEAEREVFDLQAISPEVDEEQLPILEDA